MHYSKHKNVNDAISFLAKYSGCAFKILLRLS